MTSHEFNGIVNNRNWMNRSINSSSSSSNNNQFELAIRITTKAITTTRRNRESSSPFTVAAHWGDTQHMPTHTHTRNHIKLALVQNQLITLLYINSIIIVAAAVVVVAVLFLFLERSEKKATNLLN